MKRKIAVVGAGSAGLLTAAHLTTWLDDSWQICSIHDPNKKILGIGESTNGAFISVLERATNFSVAHAEDLAALDATIKYGSKFVNWRDQEWINPLLSGNIAIHFNNHRFKPFVLSRLEQLWPSQFSSLEADVQSVENYADHVTLRTDAGAYDFDYVVDCRGTPSAFDGYTLSDCTLVDRCRIHTVEGYTYEPFTDHIATRDGWMFGVPLKGYKTYGYLYNHEITDTEDAERELMRLLGTPRLEAGGYDAHYAFRCYYANEIISGRLCKNGNRALFFEPLLANSMFLYIYVARLIYDHIVSAQEASACNTRFAKAIHEVEDVISYYYKGGSTFDTEFWRASADRANARLGRRPELAQYFAKLRDLKKRGVMHSSPAYAFSPNTWQIVDTHMGYRSFETPESSI
jgi:Tryptophan halogenase